MIMASARRTYIYLLNVFRLAASASPAARIFRTGHRTAATFRPSSPGTSGSRHKRVSYLIQSLCFSGYANVCDAGYSQPPGASGHRKRRLDKGFLADVLRAALQP